MCLPGKGQVCCVTGPPGTVIVQARSWILNFLGHVDTLRSLSRSSVRVRGDPADDEQEQQLI